MTELYMHRGTIRRRGETTPVAYCVRPEDAALVYSALRLHELLRAVAWLLNGPGDPRLMREEINDALALLAPVPAEAEPPVQHTVIAPESEEAEA